MLKYFFFKFGVINLINDEHINSSDFDLTEISSKPSLTQGDSVVYYSHSCTCTLSCIPDIHLDKLFLIQNSG